MEIVIEISHKKAEWEIMNILWKFPEATITQIVAELNKKKFCDKYTVITLLSRMEKKGWSSTAEMAGQKNITRSFHRKKRCWKKPNSFWTGCMKEAGVCL